ARDSLAAMLETYRAKPDDAAKLITTGAKPPPQDIDPAELAKLEKRAAKQYAILFLLINAPDRTLPVADLGESSAPSLKSLAAKGFIKISTEDVRRDPEATETIVPSEPLVLNNQQQEAFNQISAS
ncbi:MAG: hypothetical protein ACK47H_04755, partial [Akkermansiaceae bacterium]